MGNFCRNCGKEMEMDVNFCESCGTNNQNTIYVKQNPLEKNAMIGFILGLCSTAAWLLPLLGYPVAVCGIVFSAKGLKPNKNKGKAIAGLTLSIIFLVLTLINSALGVVLYLTYLERLL